MPTAVLIDGGYFIKRYRALYPDGAHDATRAADQAWRWAMLHMREGAKGGERKYTLYRIFFYDCPPLLKKLHNPLTGKLIDFSKTDEARFRTELHARLRRKRKVALRMGHLSGDTPWTLVPSTIQDLLKKKRSFDELSESDLLPNVRQKGVDMRIGIDIASLAFKRQVDQIILVAGDADFVPAAKLARREGIDFILDPMWRSIDPGLNEHIDGLRSTCTRPTPKAVRDVTGNSRHALSA